MADETTQTIDKKAKKKAKKKGPIRIEAIAPFCIVVALFWVYFALFFDGHLRRGLEFVGTHANGAEVNIDDVTTSFWKASLAITNVQVTNATQPTHNSIQIGKIRWRMLWDALLRGKVAIADASILEIGVGTERKRPGKVLPPDPPSSESATEKIRDMALQKAQEQFDGNVLGDIAAILGGVDPQAQLKNIQASLASQTRITELQTELKNKEEEWKKRINALPKSETFKEYEARLKGIKLDGFKNPAEIQVSVKEIDSLIKDVDGKVKETEATGKQLGSDVNNYSKALKDLEEMVRKDIKDLESRLKIPQLDVKNLATSLFGPMIFSRIKQAEFYMTKARQYMPPKKTEAQKAEFDPPKPHERIAGRNYRFPKTNAYPLFWLQNAELSSTATGMPWSGNIKGQLTDVTNDPPLIGKPMRLTFNGDFPKQELMDVGGEIVIDHTTERPMESMMLRVGSFPVSGNKLVSSSDVTLAFEKAIGTSELNVSLQEENVDFAVNSVFDKVAYTVDAKQKLVKEILTNVLNSVPRVTLNGGVKGTWSNLDFSLNSNLGAEIQKGFQAEINAKIAEARAKVEAFVNEKIGAEKAKLQAEYKKVEDKIKGEVASKQAEVDKFKSKLEEEKQKVLKSQGKKLETEGKKQLENLFKGKKLKF